MMYEIARNKSFNALSRARNLFFIITNGLHTGQTNEPLFLSLDLTSSGSSEITQVQRIPQG